MRRYSVVYDKADRYFKDKAKKELGGEDGAKEANLVSLIENQKNYFKGLGSPLNANQTTQSYPGKINSFVD